MFFEITKNEDVVATGAEGIVEHRHRPEENFGVFTGGLFSGRAIIVPDGDIVDTDWALLQHLGLATHVETAGGVATTHPDVFSEADISLGKIDEGVATDVHGIECDFHDEI